MVRRFVVLTTVLLGLSASPTLATTINVTTTQDVLAHDGQCSLREAVNAANTDTARGPAPGECPAGDRSGNQIVLSAGVYSLSYGELSVSSVVMLAGQGASATTINGNGVDRVLDVLDHGNLTMRNLRVIGGHAPGGTPSTGAVAGASGGSGGGIRSAGSLTLEDVTISGNAAGAGGNGVAGSAAGAAPGAGGSGGGIASTGASLTISDSTIGGNSAGAGGDDTLAQVGGAGGDGGGIDASGGRVDITGSTISGNRAGNGGFGGLIGGIAGDGGGMSFGGPVIAKLTNDTIASNSGGHTGSPLPPAGSSSDGGAVVQDGGSVAMTQVTIAENGEDDAFNCCHNVSSAGGMTITDSALDGTCGAVVTDGGHNVSLGGGGCPGVAANVQLGSPAFNLGPLRDNGGPTQTMLPGRGSALIDEVDSLGTGCLPTDQRGVQRPQGSACDAGSVEAQAPVVAISRGRLRSPARLKFAVTRVGRGRRATVRITYAGGEIPLTPGTAKISGRNARDFRIAKNRCRDKTLHRSQSCTLVISFRPRRLGLRRANVTLNVRVRGRPVKVEVVGTGLR